ncbi:invasin domain 3-containing protein [Tissierella praeacuta]|uniref:invasin domain 3-containing protein n=1 Tax=Tissierella praeacuta TaxID=43131 RepID=UPI00334199D5
MKPVKRITSLVLASSIVLSSASALAADFDLKVKETGTQKEFLEWIFDDEIFLDVALGEEGKYLIEYDNKFYKAEEVVKSSTENPNAGLGELVKDLAPVEETEEELKVVKVSAISKTVDKNGTLEFAINGKSEAAKLQDVIDAGYEVKFIASAKVFGNLSESIDDAKVNITGDVKKFEYQVVVSKEGKEVAKSERVSVDVQEYAKTVTSIESIKVVAGGVELATGTIGLGTGAKFEIKGKTKDMKAEDEAVKLINSIFEFKSNRPGVISVDADGNLTANAKGEATITVKSGDFTKDVKLNVGEAGQISAEKSTVSTKALEISSGKAAKFTVVLKDQNGNPVTGVEDSFVFANETVIASKTVTEDDEVKGTYEVEVTAAAKAASADVELKVDNVEIAKIRVSVKEPGDIVNYELELTEKKLDIKGVSNVAGNFKLKGLDKNGLVKEEDLIKADEYVLEVEGDNKQNAVVANNKITFDKAGSYAVVAKKVNGSFKDEVDRMTVEVIDTTPSIESAKFTTVKKVEKEEAIKLEDILTIDAKGPEGKVETEFVLNNEDIVEIKEKTSDGTPSVVIGKVKLIADKGVTAAFDDKEIRITAGEGKVNLTVVNHNDDFIADTNIEVKIAQ